MKTIVKILLATFVLLLAPTVQTLAQEHIEPPKNRQQREAEAKRKKQQQDAARRQREAEEARRKREAEENEERRMRPFRELEANMVSVEGGTFIMGATNGIGSEYEGYWARPVHQVTLPSFKICKYEVTQGLWLAVMGKTPTTYISGKNPVEGVSWNDCQEFISNLNRITGKHYRLPTEAEWEYAARGGNGSQGYKYAGSDNIDVVAWYQDNSNGQAHPVGMKRANELGLYDMAGNVSEWCSDWFGKYSSESQTDPQGVSSGSERVTRGGCYKEDVSYGRVSARIGSMPTNNPNGFGLRLAE